MKRILYSLSVLSLLSFFAKSQSKVEFQSGTIIEVQADADISADTVIINGAYLGDGTINHGPLPVELNSFVAAAIENKIELHWRTATETNNYGFDIERLQNFKSERLQYLPDGKAGWEKIGFVEGKGTTTEIQSYSFIDNNLKVGVYTYRIKQIDFDGSYVYFNLTEDVEISTPKEFALLQNYPNPFNPTTIIKFQMPFEGHISLIVFDILGKEVMTLVNENKEAGFHEINFNGSSLASGMYIYRLNVRSKAGNYLLTKKMVLLR